MSKNWANGVGQVLYSSRQSGEWGEDGGGAMDGVDIGTVSGQYNSMRKCIREECSVINHKMLAR